jgi:hypothetical protein
MKTNFRIIAVLLVVMTSCMLTPRVSSQRTNASFQLFYDELSPYGQWTDYGDYGYVWIPDAGDNFEPYSSDGHWIMTDYGWTWASDYDWGWAAFHYGRWSYANSFGWFWVPDNEWGPAWVNWRQADGYYGWSPMEPGITINLSFRNEYNSGNDHWMFVRDRDFDRADVSRYYVNRNEHERISRNSVVINNTYRDSKRNTTYVTGPSRNDIQNVTGRRIVSTTIQDNSRPGKGVKNGRLQIYRPQIQNNNAGQKPTPKRITNQNDVKRNPTRDAVNKNEQVNPGNIQQNDNNQQNRVTQPVNQERINQPVRSTQPVQQREVAPQNNVQPKQERNVNQQENQPQPQNIEPVKTEKTSQPIQQREITPQNNAQPKQERSVNQQESNRQKQRQNSPAKVENRSQQVQPKTVSQPVVKEEKSIKQEIRKEQDRIPDKVPENR